MGNESIKIIKQRINTVDGLDLICPAFVDKLFREHHERVYLAAYRISGNAHDAEDVLQSVFLGLLKRSDNGNNHAGVNPKNYLCRSAINASLDILRSKGRRQILDLEDIDEQAGPASLGGANDLLQTELRKQLPQRIDKVTQLTDVTSNDLELLYIHEIDIGTKSTKTVRNEDNSRMKEAITYGVCTRAKNFLDSNIVLTYVYNNAKTKEELFKFKITPKACEGIWAK